MTTKAELLRVIRAKCIDCAYTANEVALCNITDCALHPYRFGKDPTPSRARVKMGKKLREEQINEDKKD